MNPPSIDGIYKSNLFVSLPELEHMLGVSQRTIQRFSYEEKTPPDPDKLFRKILIGRRRLYYLPQVLSALGIEQAEDQLSKGQNHPPTISTQKKSDGQLHFAWD